MPGRAASDVPDRAVRAYRRGEVVQQSTVERLGLEFTAKAAA